jgi:RNA polymerase subunit RPABC4/transcription elongation factor Spt4
MRKIIASELPGPRAGKGPSRAFSADEAITICEWVDQGGSIKDAALAAGVTERTIRNVVSRVHSASAQRPFDRNLNAYECQKCYCLFGRAQKLCPVCQQRTLLRDVSTRQRMMDADARFAKRIGREGN